MSVPFVDSATLAKLSGLNAAIVLLRLSEIADSNGRAKTSLRDLGRDLGIDPGHVSRHVRELETIGLICSTRERDTNVYTLIYTRGAVQVNTGSVTAGRNAGQSTQRASADRPGTPSADGPIIHVTSPVSVLRSDARTGFFHARSAALERAPLGASAARQDATQAKRVPPPSHSPPEIPLPDQQQQQRARPVARAPLSTPGARAPQKRELMLDQLAQAAAAAGVTGDGEGVELLIDAGIDPAVAPIIAQTVPADYIRKNLAGNTRTNGLLFASVVGDYAGWLRTHARSKVAAARSEESYSIKAERERQREEKAVEEKQRAEAELRALEHLSNDDAAALLQDYVARCLSGEENRAKRNSLVGTFRTRGRTPMVRAALFEQLEYSGANVAAG